MIDHSTPSCPFCSFSDSDANFVAEHVEFCHPDNGGPSAVSPNSLTTDPAGLIPSLLPINEDGPSKYIDCPHRCGETVLATELATHLDLHVAENLALDESETTQVPSSASSVSRDHALPSSPEDLFEYPTMRKGGKKDANRDFTRPSTAKSKRPKSPPTTIGPDGARRLGRSELGPHAHEKKMPLWLRKMLEKGGTTSKQTQITPDGKLLRRVKIENETDHLIPVIASLCEQDHSVRRAFLCSPKIRHICKMPYEGGFCGYRNIQMLISYITKAQGFGHEHFLEGVPTILELQDKIEIAWDMGFNSVGRTETGGIRGTRKFIGTPEAQALLLSLDIPCDASSLSESGSLRAHESLYTDVAAYFRSVCALEDERTKVFKTDLPPIYLQHKGHSMTIIGFEIRDDGSANLLVFDPMFKTSPAMQRFIGNPAKSNNPARLLKAYRRGTPYLQKYKLFELLKLRTPEIISAVSG